MSDARDSHRMIVRLSSRRPKDLTISFWALTVPRRTPTKCASKKEESLGAYGSPYGPGSLLGHIKRRAPARAFRGNGIGEGFRPRPKARKTRQEGATALGAFRAPKRAPIQKTREAPWGRFAGAWDRDSSPPPGLGFKEAGEKPAQAGAWILGLGRAGKGADFCSPYARQKEIGPSRSRQEFLIRPIKSIFYLLRPKGVEPLTF